MLVAAEYIDAKIDELTEKLPNGDHVCRVCGNMSRIRQNIRKHVETHIQTEGFPCEVCGKYFRTRNSLNTHKSVQHRSSANNTKSISMMY